MKVLISQPRPECVVVERSRSWARLATAATTILASLLTLAFVDLASVPGLALLLLSAPVLALLGVSASRSASAATWTLVRSQGRLLVNGEPLELARVELRVEQRPITRVPRGYTLSLWMMTAAGPLDVPLGRYRTLIEASSISGTLEDFVQRASTRQPGHTGA